MTAADIHHCGVKSGDGMPLFFCPLDKCLCHGKAVAAFARTSGDDYDFFVHMYFLLPLVELTCYGAYIIILIRIGI